MISSSDASRIAGTGCQYRRTFGLCPADNAQQWPGPSFLMSRNNVNGDGSSRRPSTASSPSRQTSFGSPHG